MTIDEDILLQCLRPVDVSYKTGENDICLEGTRRSLLARAEAWIHQPSSSTGGLFWVFGPAGSGKTTFANTLVQRLDSRNNIDLTFFSSKRGPQIFSNPRRLLDTIAYRIACTYERYRVALLEALSDNITPFNNIYEQYERILGDILPDVDQPAHLHAYRLRSNRCSSEQPACKNAMPACSKDSTRV